MRFDQNADGPGTSAPRLEFKVLPKILIVHERHRTNRSAIYVMGAV